MEALRGMWYIVYQYFSSWFDRKPVVRPLDPREPIHTTKKVRLLPVGKPPLSPHAAKSKVLPPRPVIRSNHYEY